MIVPPIVVIVLLVSVLGIVMLASWIDRRRMRPGVEPWRAARMMWIQRGLIVLGFTLFTILCVVTFWNLPVIIG
ncbi:hypothetical protein HN358_00425 [Candidatus Uhrbacteria bacterium]|jgi:hypothetical protein|nr:hypothetical protein [Candidatus Uhrbacteria bacterium]MBT7717693.1 hypothetical protein [Candidatus Uhrbacteria bacterium]